MTSGRVAEPEESARFAREAPALSLDHIKNELELLHQGKRRTPRSALFARLAEPDRDGATIDVTTRAETVRFRVIDTSGELDLRRKLAREREEATVYIVPFAPRLPRDLEAVFASGRLWWPQDEWLLPRRFGAKSGTSRLLGSKLRRVAQRDGTRTYARGDAPSIDLDDAWLVFLRDRLVLEALETEAQLFTATLLDREHRGLELAALLAKVPEARDELADVIERRMSPSARRVLAAWLEDAAVELAAMGVVGEATRSVLNDPRGEAFGRLMSAVEMRVVQIPGHPLRPVRDAARAAGLAKALVELGYLMPLVWPKLESAGASAGASRNTEDPLRRAILGQAELVFSVESVRELALASDRLPFVFEHRCKGLVEAIDAVVDASDTASVERAIEAVDRTATELLAHEAARGDAALREQVEMASRLAAFLREPVARTALAHPERVEPPHAEVIRLATFQAEAGGYVDWARNTVRVDRAGPLGNGLRRLVAEVDRVRDALDVRFARAYAQVVGDKGDRGMLRGAARVEGRSLELFLIEDALTRMALDLLERDRGLRLLVLCMDGMSWANLAELEPSMERTSFVPVSHGSHTPVLAHVPTITKLSRGALFAGRALGPNDSLDTGRDGERLAQHAVVRRIGEPSIVLLRGDILGEGGGLSDDAARDIRGDCRLVAVVVNAIDDQLKGSPQLRVTLSTEHIRPLQALLEAAESTGRLVLLASDHGHISSQRFSGTAARSARKEPEGAERGARYRFLGASDAAAPDEIALPAGALGVAKGTDRLAVAVHETVRYTSLLHAGEHGGASLAEAIAPAVLLAPRGLLPDLHALGLRDAPLPRPAFWSRDQARAEREAVHTPPPPPAAPARLPAEPAAKQEAQVALPFDAVPSKTLPRVRPALVDSLFRSRLFEVQLGHIAESERPQVKRAIELLVHHGGRMLRDQFAVELQIDAGGKGTRVRGFLTSLERVLNFDQEPVVGMDVKGLVVTLDEPRLRSTFLEDEGG